MSLERKLLRSVREMRDEFYSAPEPVFITAEPWHNHVGSYIRELECLARSVAERNPLRGEPAWGRLDDARAFVTDGTAMLVVDDAPDAPAPVKDGREWEGGSTSAERVLSTTVAGPVDLALTSEQVTRATEAKFVRIGGTHLDTSLVRAFVLFAMSISPGPVTATYSASDTTTRVRFRGEGWTALVMPIHADDSWRTKHAEDIVRLDEVAGG